MMRGLILCASIAFVSSTPAVAVAGEGGECRKADPVLQDSHSNMPTREKSKEQRKGEDCRKTRRIVLM